jgi:hypothetical protein
LQSLEIALTTPLAGLKMTHLQEITFDFEIFGAHP